MAKRTDRFVVDGFPYELTQFGTVEGRPLWSELRNVALNAIGELASGDILQKLAGGLDKLDDKDAAELLKFVIGLLKALPLGLEDRLVAALARNCKVGVPAEGQHGKQYAFVELGDTSLPDGIYDQHFAGRYMSLQKWFLQGLKINFAGFLGDLGSGSPPATPATPSQ